METAARDERFGVLVRFSIALIGERGPSHIELSLLARMFLSRPGTCTTEQLISTATSRSAISIEASPSASRDARVY